MLEQGLNEVTKWIFEVPGKRNSRSQGPEAAVSFGHLRHSKEASVAGAESATGRMRSQEVTPWASGLHSRSWMPLEVLGQERNIL